jgi:hypothetical protein
MIYNKKLQDLETLENHQSFYATIKRICERDFVLSSANPLGNIFALQNKIEVFIKTEERLHHRDKDQRLRNAQFAFDWLDKVYHDLIDSGLAYK